MIWLPLAAFFVGFFLVWQQGITVPDNYASYLSLAAIAGIDTLLGGVRSAFEGKFRSDIFLSGFVVNTFIAALLAYFGDQIGVSDLYLAAVIALGGRIFLNLSLIRHTILGRPRPDRFSLRETGLFGGRSPFGTPSTPPKEAITGATSLHSVDPSGNPSESATETQPEPKPGSRNDPPVDPHPNPLVEAQSNSSAAQSNAPTDRPINDIQPFLETS